MSWRRSERSANKNTRRRLRTQNSNSHGETNRAVAVLCCMLLFDGAQEQIGISGGKKTPSDKEFQYYKLAQSYMGRHRPHAVFAATTADELSSSLHGGCVRLSCRAVSHFRGAIINCSAAPNMSSPLCPQSSKPTATIFSATAGFTVTIHL